MKFEVKIMLGVELSSVCVCACPCACVCVCVYINFKCM